MPTGTRTLTVDVHLTAADLDAALRDDVRRGLTSSPKDLPPKWFYDHRGSQLFDQITRLPEYYPTRREREIIEAHAADVAAFGADTVVELGSGTSEKSRILLDAMHREGSLRTYCPFDVSESFLRDAAAQLAQQEPWLQVHALVGDFEHHLGRLPEGDRRLVAFLGSTIGNLDPAGRARFFADLADGLRPGDALLLGTDLVKAEDRLVAAYDDAAGVTAEFNRNVLRVIDRELHADFDVEAFQHVARWDAEQQWIEMHLRSTRAQQVHVADLDLTVDFAEGELLRTEISAKFTRERVEAELAAAGFRLAEWWTDEAHDFALTLSTRN